MSSMQTHTASEPGRRFAAATVWIVGTVVLLTVPALIPFTRAGFWESHDGLIHLYRLLSLRDALGWGEWYPRLFPDFAFNYGFAVLHYYAPLTYYLALAFTGLGLSAVNAVKFTFALSLPLAALAMWWLARTVWRSDPAGILAAGVYTYVPYHLADVHLRGALAESWAFVWWPLILWAAWQRRLYVLTLSLAGLVLTHNLSAVLIAPVLALWLLAAPWLRAESGRLQALAGVVGTGLLAALLSAFYWLPVLLESRWVHLAVDVGGRGFVRHLQPFSEWVAPEPLYAYFPNQGVAGEHPLAWVQVALIAFALLVALAIWRRLPARGAFVVMGIILFLSVVLLTPISLPAWDLLVFPVGMVQYPWRWLGITALATGVMSGVLVLPLPSAALRWVLALGATVVLAATTLPGLPWERVEVVPDTAPEEMWARDYENQQIGATWTAEYLPRWVREERWAVPRPVERPAVGEVMAPAEIRLARAVPWAYQFTVDAETPLALRLHQFYLPAWQASVDGEPVETRPDGSLGLVAVTVPAGTHEVVVGWSRTLPVTIGIVLSALGAIVLAGSRLRVHGLPARGRTAGAILVLAVLIVGLVGARPDSALRPLETVNADVGDRATLLGWRADAAVEPGDTTRVTLYWLGRRTMPVDYSVFVHLTRSDGVPLAQSDGTPGAGYTPTSRWLAGEVIPDPHRLVAPTDISPGAYELWTGLYDPATGERLPVEGRDDGRLFLGKVEVSR